MPLSAGMRAKNRLKASSPPAEAPMPTTGKTRTAAGSIEVGVLGGSDLRPVRHVPLLRGLFAHRLGPWGRLPGFGWPFLRHRDRPEQPTGSNAAPIMLSQTRGFRYSSAPNQRTMCHRHPTHVVDSPTQESSFLRIFAAPWNHYVDDAARDPRNGVSELSGTKVGP